MRLRSWLIIVTGSPVQPHEQYEDVGELMCQVDWVPIPREIHADVGLGNACGNIHMFKEFFDGHLFAFCSEATQVRRSSAGTCVTGSRGRSPQRPASSARMASSATQPSASGRSCARSLCITSMKGEFPSTPCTKIASAVPHIPRRKGHLFESGVYWLAALWRFVSCPRPRA